MGMLDFLKDDPDDEFDDLLDEDLDDLDDEDLLDDDFDEDKPSKSGLLSRFKKPKEEPEIQEAVDNYEEEDDDLTDIDFSFDHHSFSSDYQASLIRQSQQARKNLERRTLAALEEIRHIAGQEPVINTSRNTAGYDGEETDDYSIDE